MIDAAHELAIEDDFVELTPAMEDDLEWCIALTIAFARGLLPWPAEMRDLDPEEGGRRYAIRAIGCDCCRAWAATLEARGPLPLHRIAPGAKAAPASYSDGEHRLCRQCFAELDSLPKAARAIELKGMDLRQFATPEGVLACLDARGTDYVALAIA